MLKKIVNIRLSAANWLILSFLTVLATACSISYKFNGASIDYTKVKTITIRDFTNQAPYVNPTLAPQFTEDLKVFTSVRLVCNWFRAMATLSWRVRSLVTISLQWP